MIISLCGTNSSGKSTIARTILNLSTNTKPLYGVLGPKMPEAYKLNLKEVAKPVYLLGPYRTPTGGIDLAKTTGTAIELIKKYPPFGHVLFESVITCGAYGRTQAFMEQFGKESVVAFMDTPLEVCIVNVQKRKTQTKAYSPPFDPKNMTQKYRSMVTAKARVLKDDIMTVIDLSMETGVETILELLRNAR